MTTRCVVVSGAPGGTLDIEPDDGDFVIAADSGYLLCEQAGIAPDLLVADFDSLGESMREQVTCEIAELPVEKDDTDTLAALRIGLARGYRDFVVANALGGDVGHTLANIQCLSFLHENGARGTLRGRGQEVFAVYPEDGRTARSIEPGTRVSVFASGGTARGVTEWGLRWNLDSAELTESFPIGVSNWAVEPEIAFEVGQGTLLVVVG